jgi:transaldolase
MNKLEALKKHTIIVADTGDIDSIKEHMPEDATTNPSLILKAITSGKYDYLFENALVRAEKEKNSESEKIAYIADLLAVGIGKEILSIIPGRISTEVDARLSFNTELTIKKARELIGLYQSFGISKERILIKIASTWEGIQAAKELESEGVNCNLTLLFSTAQAKACADAGVYLISPFVGRIMDWYKAKTGITYTAEADPGVISVKNIFNFYKLNGYKTIIMGASFRNTDEIIALAGCDRLTINPELLKELSSMDGDIIPSIVDDNSNEIIKTVVTEASFRWEHNQDAMAVEKLSDGIRAFAKDQEKLELIISKKLNSI